VSRRGSRWIAALAIGLAAGGCAEPAEAEEPPPEGRKPDLTLHWPGRPDIWIRPTLSLGSAFFLESECWAGNARDLIGGACPHWAEFAVMPGLEGELAVEAAGTFRARASAVYATTQIGLDAGGSNLDDRRPHEILLEDAYLGWTSGDLFPSLGENALDLSVGSQPYQVGTGFLIWDGATDGGSRGAYWISPREAFRLTGIARLTTGPFSGEIAYFQPNDDPNTHTRVAGVNLEYAFGERATLGAGYWNVFDSDDERRDGLNVFDLRVEVTPLARLPGLKVSGEIVHEKNGSLNDSWGGYAEIGYDFEGVPWTPHLSYRFAAFSGDDGSGDNETFDPLFYGFPDWGTWYFGEIVGEYVGSNRNANVHTLRLRAHPSEAITANLLYYFFHLRELADRIVPRPPLPPRLGLIEDEDIAHELDLAIDWSPFDYVTVSAVAGALFLEAGGRQFFDSDEIWSHYMLYVGFEF
jgi:hypothetical protein